MRTKEVIHEAKSNLSFLFFLNSTYCILFLHYDNLFFDTITIVILTLIQIVLQVNVYNYCTIFFLLLHEYISLKYFVSLSYFVILLKY